MVWDFNRHEGTSHHILRFRYCKTVSALFVFGWRHACRFVVCLLFFFLLLPGFSQSGYTLSFLPLKYLFFLNLCYTLFPELRDRIDLSSLLLELILDIIWTLLVVFDDLQAFSLCFNLTVHFHLEQFLVVLGVQVLREMILVLLKIDWYVDRVEETFDFVLLDVFQGIEFAEAGPCPSGDNWEGFPALLLLRLVCPNDLVCLAIAVLVLDCYILSNWLLAAS